MQIKKQSFIEAIVATFIGFIISLLTSPIINWICGIKANAKQVTLSVVLFTIISIIRGFFVRRYFNHKHKIKS